ncbi:hypothetical protein [Priestia megaterium]|uniref:hypothetical protein n=1 Tax=Priestia megaterium TaxID=1404 RepID=UPI000BFE62C1|nr:hypothetical protein [Priestia megaterium]PGQ88225.1 hypothetical protein COA18_04680 [Priestia megaterium]
MNELMTRDDYFSFDVQILFKTYSEVVRLWGMPTIERIRDLYDDCVKDRLNMFYYDMKPYELGSSNELLIHNLRKQPEDVLKQVSDLIGMKALLETEEFIEVFNYYQMFYIDDFDDYHNLPNREVW